MKKLFIIFVILQTANIFAQETIILGDKQLGYAEITAIADGTKVKLSTNAIERIKKGHDILITAAESGHAIYGLTVGVGLNKDKSMIDSDGKLSAEVQQLSRDFNKGLIYAHIGAVGDKLPIRTVRAAMATRLNNIAYGSTGVTIQVAQQIEDFLNNGITPVMPETGSIGMADITIMGHLGLALIGEGKVYYKNKEIAAATAIKKAGLKPIVLYAKDALSIVSSNALAVGRTVLLMSDLEQLIKVSKVVYAISLEGLNGNIAPISAEAMALRPYKVTTDVATEIRNILKGSYLWNVDNERALQDPLSYRDSVHYIAALERSFNELNELMLIQQNFSDDNPGVSLNTVDKPQSSQEEKFYVKSGGAVVPTSNFDPIIWALALENVSVTLGVNSTLATQRTIKLNNEYFTKLTRFLGTDKTVHAFGAMEKPITALNAENLYYANPAVTYSVPVAGNIEDIATNVPFITKKVQQQINNLFQIYGIELVHATQAVNLRMAKNDTTFKLSTETKVLFDSFRTQVEFLEVDRPLSSDFSTASSFLMNY